MTRYVLLALAIGCSSKSPAGEAPGPSGAAAEGGGTAGRVATERFHSDALGVDKAVLVYLPLGYDAQASRRWPVFYYLHGISGSETDWVEQGNLDATADRLGLDAIVVMPDGDDSFYVDSRFAIDHDRCMADGTGLAAPTEQPRDATCVRKRSYETYIVEDLIGWVDGRYRTIASREGRAIAGLSMGGFGALELALRHPDRFAAAASHSGSIGLLFAGPRPFAPGKSTVLTDVSSWGGPGEFGAWVRNTFGPDIADWKAHDVVELAGKLPSGKVALYIDCGTEDDFGLFDNAQHVHEALTAKKVEHEFVLVPGKHDWAFWSARLPDSLAFLRDHAARPR